MSTRTKSARRPATKRFAAADELSAPIQPRTKSRRSSSRRSSSKSQRLTSAQRAQLKRALTKRRNSNGRITVLKSTRFPSGATKRTLTVIKPASKSARASARASARKSRKSRKSNGRKSGRRSRQSIQQILGSWSDALAEGVLPEAQLLD